MINSDNTKENFVKNNEFYTNILPQVNNLIKKLKDCSCNNSDDFIEKYKLLYNIKQLTTDTTLLKKAQKIVDDLVHKNLTDTLKYLKVPANCVNISNVNIFEEFDIYPPEEASDESDYYALKSVHEEIFNYYLKIYQHVTRLAGESKDFISNMAIDIIENHPVTMVITDAFKMPKTVATRLSVETNLLYNYQEDKELSLHEKYEKLYTLFNDFRDELYVYEETEENDWDYYLDKIVVCFTGFRDDELVEKIEEYGGKYVSSITSDCNILVCKSMDKITKKIMEAKNKGISVVSLEDFMSVASYLHLTY